MFSLPAVAVEQVRLDRLFQQLKQVEEDEARKVAAEISLEFSKSGSAAMDLLLKRGRDALEGGDVAMAIEHLTALTDHAPEFAEGWHMRAVAFTQQGLYGLAVADLERTLALRPRHFDAIFGLGVVLEEMNRPDMAREAFVQVLEIYPYHEHVGDALERLNGTLNGENL